MRLGSVSLSFFHAQWEQRFEWRMRLWFHSRREQRAVERMRVSPWQCVLMYLQLICRCFGAILHSYKEPCELCCCCLFKTTRPMRTHFQQLLFLVSGLALGNKSTYETAFNFLRNLQVRPRLRHTLKRSFVFKCFTDLPSWPSPDGCNSFLLSNTISYFINACFFRIYDYCEDCVFLWEFQNPKKERSKSANVATKMSKHTCETLFFCKPLFFHEHHRLSQTSWRKNADILRLAICKIT